MKQIILLCAFLAALPAYSSMKFIEKLNLHYGPHERQVFDIWYPKSRIKKAPLVLYIHGGGFVSGDKSSISEKYRDIIKKYNHEGIAFAAINYRYLTHAPLQVIMREDIAGFIQFIRYHSKSFHIDKSKIMSFGFSAGGSSSLWLGTHDDIADPNNADPIKRESSRVLAIGHCNAQVTYDMQDWIDFFGKDAADRFLGKQLWTRYHFNSADDLKTEQGIAVRNDLDMYQNMTSDDAPMFFWNNMPDKDPENGDQYFHSPRHTRLLAEKAKKLGIVSDSEIIADGSKVTDVMNAVHDFFIKRLSQ